jgi:hypothetical protein
VAITLAMYAALLAFATMLTNEARTQSLLLSNEASNKWAYYQAKSTKQLVSQSELNLAERMGWDASRGEDALVVHLKRELLRYEDEKNAIKADAEGVVSQMEHAQHKEHLFEYASTLAELAIVVASLSLLFGSRRVFLGSTAFIAGAVGFMLYAGVVLQPHAAGAAPAHEGAKADAHEDAKAHDAAKAPAH